MTYVELDNLLYTHPVDCGVTVIKQINYEIALGRYQFSLREYTMGPVDNCLEGACNALGETLDHLHHDQ